MSKEIRIIPGDNPNVEDSTFYVPEMSVAVSMSNTAEVSPRPTNTILDPHYHANTNEPIWPWGDDNLEPKHIFKDIADNDFLMPVIEKKAKLIYGQGLSYFRVKMVQQKNGVWMETYEPLNVPEINTWLRNTRAEEYIHTAAINKFATGNFFPEIILGKHTRKINKIHCLDSVDVRLGLQDKTTGNISKSFISANWDTGSTNIKAIEVDVIDRLQDVVKTIQAEKTKFKFVIPTRTLYGGEKYYAKEPLAGLRKSGWLRISANVPKWQVNVMEQQLSLKFHLEIDISWWEWKYPGFHQKSDKVKNGLMKQEITTFLNTMKGIDGAGNVLMTNMKIDPQTKEQYSLWKITPIDNTKFEGGNMHLEYAQEADLRTIRALGMHPTLFGAARGKGSAGSGSDIRVAQNTAILESKPDQDEFLKSFVYSSEVNGWNAKHGGDTGEIKWMFNSYYVARLDSGKEISDKPEHKGKDEE